MINCIYICIMVDMVAFLSLFGWYESLKVDFGLRYSVRHGFQIEWFVTLGLVGCFGGVKGISVRKLVLLFNKNIHGVTHSTIEKRMQMLLKYGYVVRVKRGRFFYYSLSSHAEKLLQEAVGAKELKRLNSHVRLLLKS